MRFIHKKAGWAALFLSLALMKAGAAAAVPDEVETSKSFVLDNGLKVFLLEKRNYPLVSAVAAVNVGTKDETPETSGLVHILEHYILFRGTELRSGNEIGRDVRRHGAYFNAHTGQDIAFFEICAPAENAEFALINQRDILFNLKLTQEELDREKEVVLEEFSQMEDDPIRRATSLVYQNLFRGHPYGNPPHGRPETVRDLTVEGVQEFYQKYFVPSNCSLAVVGDLGLEQMESIVRKIFVEVKGERLAAPEIAPAPPLEENIRIDVEMDVQKAYLVIATRGPDFDDPDQYAIDILTEIFGRGVNPMLYAALWGRRKLAETIQMAYHAHKHGGALIVYLTLDPKYVSAAEREAISFLKRSRDQNFSPQDVFGEQQQYAYDFLSGAKNQISFSVQQSQEKSLVLAYSLARSLILSEDGEYRPYLANIDKVDSSDLRKAAAKYFSRSDYVIISIVPPKESRR
jgi:zinc protease